MQSRIITRGKVEILEHEPPKAVKPADMTKPKPETKDTNPKEPKVEQ
jgi:hypothetical protein